MLGICLSNFLKRMLRRSSVKRATMKKAVALAKPRGIEKIAINTFATKPYVFKATIKDNTKLERSITARTNPNEYPSWA
jgi:hypothetical protein